MSALIHTPARAPSAASPSPAPTRPLRPSTQTVRVPLTTAQREICFASQIAPALSLAYHESVSVRLTGPLNVDALRASLQQLMDRHDALRATFSSTGEHQTIAAEMTIPIAWRDLSATAPAARETAAADCVDLHLHHPFDLATGPLFRALLVRLAPETHVVVLIAHHIVCDGWSLGVLVRELGEFYSAQVAGREPVLPAAPRFADYAANAQAARSAPAFAAAESYWKRQFADSVPVLELPTDKPRPAQRTYEGGCVLRTLPADVTAGVKRLCGEKQCTPFTIMFAAFSLLMHRLTGQDDVVVGVFSAGQVLGGQPAFVGHFSNLLPLRWRLQPGLGFGAYLDGVKQALTSGLEQWQYPYVELVQSLNLARDSNRVALAPVVFNAVARAAAPKFAALGVEVTGNPKRFVNFDLNVNFVVGRETILMSAHYSAELFARATIERWFEHFETLLRGMAEKPAGVVSEFPVLSAAQRTQMLVTWNNTALDYPRDACVHQLFEEQVRRQPDAVALVSGRERVTYADLDRRAGAIAVRLRALGVGPDRPVGIFLERTPHLLAAMLAVLKAGGAYVPLDRGWPLERLDFVVTDTRMPVIVSEASLARHLPPSNLPVLLIDAPAECHVIRDTFPQASEAEPGKCHVSCDTSPGAVGATNVAYVIYTSGSTGRPKGVCVMHRGVVALAAWARQFYRPEDFDGILFATSASFDVSVFESLVPLMLGGKIVIAEDLFHLPTLPAVDEVRFMSGVPSAVAELVRAKKVPLCVRTVNLCGEVCPQALVDALYALPQIERVVDVYGPTETTVYSTGSVRKAGGRQTIGRPLSNEQVYVLDRQMQPVPVGVRGELYIGGDKLARGYLHRPELTAERFLTVAALGGARVYRTGDAARFLPDGTLEYLGRLDDQVKIRGYRIELGEINAVLAEVPGVAECAALSRPDPSGAARIVAYVVPAAGVELTGARLREHLSQRLPDYMVPGAFVVLETLPRTTSGKVDRARLPEPETSRATTTHLAPRTTTEELIAEIWRDVLAVERVGVLDNFFEVGGHSLLATQVIARIHDVLGVELTLRHFFAAPTVAMLGLAVETALIEDIKTIAAEGAAVPGWPKEPT